MSKFRDPKKTNGECIFDKSSNVFVWRGSVCYMIECVPLSCNLFQDRSDWMDGIHVSHECIGAMGSPLVYISERILVSTS